MSKITSKTICGIALSLTLSLPNAHAALTDGLVAYYPFNGDAQDASGNGNHGVINGNVTYVDGPVGKAAKFSGVNSHGGGQNPDHILVRNSDSLKMTNAMTVSYWVKFNSTNSQTWADCSGRVVNETSGLVLAKSGDRTGFYFSEGDLSSTFGIVPYSGGQGISSGTTRLQSALSQYRHIAYTVNGNNVSLYVNGQLLTQGTGNVNFTSANTQNIYIGTMHSQGYACLNYWGQLDGSVDELRIYNRALTATEVQEVKNFTASNEDEVLNENTFNGHYISDVLKNDGNTFILSTIKLSPITNHKNPDNVYSYKSNLYVTKVNTEKKVIRIKLGEVFPLGETPGYDTGALEISSSGDIYAFSNSTTGNDTYGMNGSIYTIKSSTMDINSTQVLFENANWGWYPTISQTGGVTHFSFAGYYKVINTWLMGSIEPATMAAEALNARVAHSGNLFTLDEFQKINDDFRPTFIQRLLGNSSSQSTLAIPCQGKILPWPYKYPDGTLCIPILNIPTGGGNYVSFYSTWKTETPLSDSPTYLITDARQYTDAITGNTLFNPVFYSNETNTVDVYFPESSGVTEKYEVMLQLPLGLRKVSNSTTPTNPTQTSCTSGASILTWQGSSGVACSAPAINSRSGQSSIIGSTNGNTGNATFTCTNGTWSGPASATCSAPTPQSCAATTLSWSGTSGQSCSAAASTANSGQSLPLSNALGNGNTGSATFTCTNGTWSSPISATCSAQTRPNLPTVN